MDFNGHTVKPKYDNMELFYVNSFDMVSVPFYLMNVYIDLQGHKNVTAIHQVDTSFNVYHNIRVVGTDVSDDNIGILFENIDKWNEENRILHAHFRRLKYGVVLRASGTYKSFGNNIFDYSAGGCDEAFRVEADSGFYRSKLRLMAWILDNQTAAYIDGNIGHSRLWIIAEGQGTGSNSYVITFGENASNTDAAEIIIGEYGTLTGVINNPYSKIVRWRRVSDIPLRLVAMSNAIPIGVSDSYGDEVVFQPDTNNILPLGMQVVLSGTLAAGETITVKITMYFNDGTTKYIEKSYTSTGTYDISLSDLWNLWASGKWVWKIVVQAKTDQATTSATVYTRIFGFK